MTHQRSTGTLHVAAKRRGDATVLDRLRQEGCLKARFPRPAPDGRFETVMLNSSGGVAGGDRLGVTATAGPGTHLVIASQAAERFYRALPGSISEVENAVSVGPAATAEWLPQESILFDGAAVRRALRVELAAGATFLGVESLLFGRAASGERVERAALSDLIEIRRAGRLLLHDRIRLCGDVAAPLARPALAAGAAAVGTILLVAPNVADLLDPIRDALVPFEAGASSWDGMLLARIVAKDGASLRRAVVKGLHVLRRGRTLPRVWMC